MSAAARPTGGRTGPVDQDKRDAGSRRSGAPVCSCASHICGPRWPNGPIARNGRRRGSSAPSPNSRSPSAPGAASSVICWKPIYHPTKRSTASTSPTCHAQPCPCRSPGLRRRRAQSRQDLLLLGPSGSGRTHISAATRRTLVENGYRVLFTQTTELMQRLRTARQNLALDAAITTPDRYNLLALADTSAAACSSPLTCQFISGTRCSSIPP